MSTFILYFGMFSKIKLAIFSVLDWPEFGHWRGLLKYPKNAKDPDAKPVLDSFMAIVAYHGQELKDWYQRAEIMKQWRRVVDKYVGEFNVSVLHDDGLFLDLVENMVSIINLIKKNTIILFFYLQPTDIWQSALGTLLTMSVICAIFMNFNIFVVVTTSAVIATILIETLGIMALMGMSIVNSFYFHIFYKKHATIFKHLL